jgi:hypothetical protein
MEIEIADNKWRLFDFYSLTPQFEMLRGDGVMRYTADYGEAHGLPGTQLSTQYVRAIVVGFDTKTQVWRLGLHVSERPGQNPSWIQLAKWPSGNSREIADNAQRAGRVLAEYANCPLKLFGIKQTPTKHKTGPLVPHERKDVPLSSVQSMAAQFSLPMEYPGMWLGRSPNGVMLKLAKDLTGGKAGEDAPPYQSCEVDKSKRVIKLLPPTGLLGAFFSTPGRQVRFDDVRNVEYRHTLIETTDFVKSQSDDNMMTEMLHKRFLWEVYLTLEGESLLLSHTHHESTSELDRTRVSDIAGTKFDTNYDIAVDYYRQHERDQQEKDEAERWTRGLALHLAADIGVKLVETEIGTDLSR